MIEEMLKSKPLPAVSELIGWTFRSWDAETRTMEVGFDGKPGFCNPMGVVQGGILTTMMDDVMGPTVLAASNGTKLCQSIDLHTHFLSAVRPGPIVVRARMVKMGNRVGFLEAELFDENGKLCARATSSAHLGDVPTAPA